jgi:hypothetical protein
LERVQPGVGVLLAQVEERHVVLPPVVVVVAEKARPQVRVIEYKPAEIAVEGLVADLDRAEVVVGREVRDVLSTKAS